MVISFLGIVSSSVFVFYFCVIGDGLRCGIYGKVVMFIV